MSGNCPPSTFCGRALHAFDERLVVSLKERVTKHSLFDIRLPIVTAIALFTWHFMKAPAIQSANDTGKLGRWTQRREGNKLVNKFLGVSDNNGPSVAGPCQASFCRLFAMSYGFAFGLSNQQQKLVSTMLEACNRWRVINAIIAWKNLPSLETEDWPCARVETLEYQYR